MIISLLHLY